MIKNKNRASNFYISWCIYVAW